MSEGATGTDRGAWRLVAGRDLWVRLRERSFIISTLINLAVITVLIVLRGVSGGGIPSYELGVVGRAPTAERLAAAPAVTMRLSLVRFDDQAAATEALREGQVDAVLDGDSLIGLHTIPAPLHLGLQASEVALRIERVISSLGGDADDIAQIADPAPLAVGVLEAGDPNRDQNGAIAFIGVLLLYGQLFGYGVWVATGVIEEKASRVVEMLLSTIRARQLMLGKIVGIGLLGLGQLAFIAAFAISVALLMGVIDVPATALGAAGIVLGYFVLGYAFYASLFAVAGSLVSRMEELQNALVPINLVILVSFIISVGALQNPDGTLVQVASIVPTSCGARDAGADRARRGGPVGDRPVDRVDAGVGLGVRPPRRSAVRGRRAPHGRPREAARRLAGRRVSRPRLTRQNLTHAARTLRYGSNPAATVYDSIGEDFFLALDRGWLNLGLWEGDESDPAEAPLAVRRLVREVAAPLATGGDVLDVGNGLAEQDPVIADVLRPRSLTALNVTLSQLRAGRPRLAEAGALAVNGDASRMPLRAGVFDGLLSVEAAFHFPSRAAFFAEAFRVLRPGGVLSTSDIATTRLPRGPREALAAVSQLRVWGLRRTAAATAEEIGAQVGAAGFTEVRVRGAGERVDRAGAPVRPGPTLERPGERAGGRFPVPPRAGGAPVAASDARLRVRHGAASLRRGRKAGPQASPKIVRNAGRGS